VEVIDGGVGLLFVRAAMDWHFNPETGSAYWLNRAKTLAFDPRADVKSVEDSVVRRNRRERRENQ
jgi:hypothetical protein